MKRIFFCAFVVVNLMLLASARADVVLYEMTPSNMTDWKSGGATVSLARPGVISITESNPSGGWGDALLDARLPYLNSAMLEVNVDKVHAGAFTVQGLAFVNGEIVKTIDMVKDRALGGQVLISMAAQPLPENTQYLLLKIWAVNAEGARVDISSLRYYLPDKTGNGHSTRVILPHNWEKDGLLAMQRGENTRLLLEPGRTYGSTMSDAAFDVSPKDSILIRYGELKNGRSAVQLIAFDKDGKYLDSVQVLRTDAPGMQIVRLSDLKWPEGTSSYRIKIWLEGDPSASLVLDGIAIIGGLGAPVDSTSGKR
ncbi:hypothetical protein KQI84_16925 [bacterium]|nr:hypothetical protein [bacterium]